MPLVPVKYPLPARYPNHYHHQQTHVNAQHGSPHVSHHPELAEDCNGNPLQYRATYVYPSHQFYIPHHTSTTYRNPASVAPHHHPRSDQRAAPSLLPTPSLIPGPHSPSSRNLTNKPKYLPPQYSRRHYGPNMVSQSYYVPTYPGRPQQNFSFHNNSHNTTAKVVSHKPVNNNSDVVADKKNPSPTPRSPTNSPPPNVSSPNPQVQSFYNNQSSQQRYHQQQPRVRYQASSPSIRKPISSNNQGSSVQRQSKYKMNGIVQSNGGAGDAGRGLPMTPPATPRGSGTGSESQLNDTCHQMQALGL